MVPIIGAGPYGTALPRRQARVERVAERLHEIRDLRDRTGVFRDRAHAGALLGAMLEGEHGSGALLLAIPAGGVPVAVEMARHLALDLDVAVVSKITPPWNSEVGYGAVAFDGTVALNDEAVAALGLGEATIRSGIDATRQKVGRRVQRFRGAKPAPDVAQRSVIVVDDGLASGFTMCTAIEALRAAGAERVVVAVPTASERSIARVEPRVDEIHCANVRGGGRFAVAEAYESWCDVSEDDAIRLFESAGAASRAAAAARVQPGPGG